MCAIIASVSCEMVLIKHLMIVLSQTGSEECTLIKVIGKVMCMRLNSTIAVISKAIKITNWRAKI